MLRDDNKGRTDKVFPEISRNDWNGQSRTEREHSTSTEIHDHLQHETKDIIAEGNRKHIRSIEQAMCSRNGDNRRVGLPLGGGSIGNRERMVWEPEGAAYDTANRKETKNWDNRQFALLKVLDSELQKQDKYASDPFCYEYGDGWSADSVDSCFCRELPYNKLRKLLCDVGDEYSLGVLIESNNNIAGLVCLTLGSFQNSLKGMSRALGTKETIAILRKMGMLASARVIVYFDNHNYSVVTILVIEAGRCQKGGDCAFSHEGTQEQKPENTTTSTVHSIQELKGSTAARFRGYGRFKIPSAEDAGE